MIKILRNQNFAYFMILTTFMDSYQIFPSSYRPLFLWVLILIFPIAFMNKTKIQNEYKYILLSYFLMGIVSLIYSKYLYGNLKGFKDYMITIILSYISYISYIYIFKHLSYKKLKNAINKIGNLLIWIGFLELFSYYGLFPKFIKKILNLIFTGGGVSRFKLISSEASWATMTLLFFFVYFLHYKNYLKSLLISLLIIGSVSAQGIISLLIYVILFLLKKDKKKFCISIIFLIPVVFFSYVGIKKILLITGNQNLYFARRLFILENINFKEIIYVDGSIFIRIIQPFIGVKMWVDNFFTFIFGLGGGNYRFEYENQFLLNYPNYYKLNREIVQNIVLLEGNPKNLYSRLLSEGGIASTILFFIGYLKIYFKSNELNKNYLILLFILYLQFDSYIYLMFPLVLAMCKVYYKTRR